MNPSEYDSGLMACVHCGLCLNACPTYLETGSEADSPRGRLVLMRYANEGKLSLKDDGVRQHLDACLGCRACETACPSGVPYGSLLEEARRQLNQSAAGVTDFVRRKSIHQFLNVLASPTAASASMHAAQWVSDDSVPLPLELVLRDPGNQTVSKVSKRDGGPTRTPEAVTAALGTKRFRVGFLAGCVMRVIYGDVNDDTVRVLAAAGCEVLVSQRQGCCGALHAHSGFTDEAKAYARSLIDAFWPIDGLDAIVINSAGCGSMTKEYGHLLQDDPSYSDKAKVFASKVRDVSEWLDEIGLEAEMNPIGPGTTRVTYHDACHLCHGQKIADAPRRILGKIPGLELIALPEADICCGSAGIYNFTEPDMANRLQRRKMDNIKATGATIVAAGNPGCLTWIQSGFDGETGVDIEVVHPITLIARSMCNPEPA